MSKGLLEKTLPSATLCWGGTTAAAAAATMTDLGSPLALVVETGITGRPFGCGIRPSGSGSSSDSSDGSGMRDTKQGLILDLVQTFFCASKLSWIFSTPCSLACCFSASPCELKVRQCRIFLVSSECWEANPFWPLTLPTLSHYLVPFPTSNDAV